MKKLVVLFMGIVFVVTGLRAQVPVSTLAEGVKLLNYEKNKSALAFFKDALDKNPTDGETIFWYGQALLAQNYNGIPTPESIQKAKEVYQKALQAKGNDPWLLVAMSHIQSLEGVDQNAVKQNLEVAITSTLNTKGKYKGKANQEIVNAIGRVYAELPISIGDHRYAIEKLKETISSYDLVNPSLYINLGINYLKLGGENGGEAVSAFQEASTRDPKNPYPYYRIGKIYQTQNNKEPLEENFRKAIEIDPTFAPVYFSLFLYYSIYDTEIAKKNLDLFLQYADKDPVYDFYNADYLFRVGQYEASLVKAKALQEKVTFVELPRLAVLLAYNYDRIGDSIQAKTYIEQYLNNNPVDKILNADYELAVKVLSKFSGNQAVLTALLEKAIAADPLKENKLKYYKLGVDMLEKSNMYVDELKWYTNYSALRGLKDELYYYKTASIAVNAKDANTAMTIAKEYIAAFPEKPQGYTLLVKGAKLLDTANQVGQVQFDAITLQTQFLLKDVVKNKQSLINNYYAMMGYYNELKDFGNAIAMCDKVLELLPGDAQTIKIKESLTKNWEIIKKMPGGGQKPDSDSTPVKKG